MGVLHGIVSNLAEDSYHLQNSEGGSGMTINRSRFYLKNQLVKYESIRRSILSEEHSIVVAGRIIDGGLE